MGQTPRYAVAQGYENGRLPDGLLVPVQGNGLRLWSTAAEAFLAMVAAAQADGVTIKITDAYRSYEDQVDLRRRKGPKWAATPGTSEHGWGEAVDINVRDGKVLAWLKANAARFGFANTVSHENWHWGYVGGSSITGTNGAVAAARSWNPIDWPGDAAGAIGGAAGAVADTARRWAILATLAAGGVVLVVLGANELTGRRASSTAAAVITKNPAPILANKARNRTA